MKKKKICVLIILLILVIVVISLVLYNNYRNNEKIKNVENAIYNIGTVTVSSESKIVAAEKMYEELSDDLKYELKNSYDTLKYIRISFDRIKSVYEDIDLLEPGSTLFVNEAQHIYDAYQRLSADEKLQITNFNKLEEYFCDEISCNKIAANKYCGIHKCLYCENIRVYDTTWKYYCSEHLCKVKNCDNRALSGDFCIIHD